VRDPMERILNMAWNHKKKRSILYILAVMVVLIVVTVVFMNRRISDHPPVANKPPESVSRHLTVAIAHQHSCESNSSYLFLYDALWRGEVDRKGLRQLCKDLALSPCKTTNVPLIFYDDLGPSWWKPYKGASVEAYTGRIPGEVDTTVYLLWDKHTKTFYALVREQD